jgi:flavin-dependent dehydrogenase
MESESILRDDIFFCFLGAGAAGLVTAAACAGLGAKVAIVEKHLYFSSRLHHCRRCIKNYLKCVGGKSSLSIEWVETV